MRLCFPHRDCLTLKYLGIMTLLVASFSHALSRMNLRVSRSVSSSSLGATSPLYEAMGRPKFISAPMVEQSSVAWRLLVRQHGCDLAYTQMIHARCFAIGGLYRKGCVDWETYGAGNEDLVDPAILALDRPLIAQFAGNCTDWLVQAGRIVENRVSAVDLNLGCPQNIARKGHYGAYLLPNKELVKTILTFLVRELKVPVTAKIRRLATDEETLELCRMIEGCGVQLLTVHGRTINNSKQYTGPVDWDIIKKIKKTVNIPVIANGGIQYYDDAIRCLDYTGADGVMSSEGLLEHPALFCPKGDLAYRTSYLRHQLSMAQQLTELFYRHTEYDGNYPQLRKHLFKILHRVLSAEKNVALRDQLSECSYQDIAGLLQETQQRYEAIDFDEGEAIRQGLLAEVSWYMRHRLSDVVRRNLRTVPRFMRVEKDDIDPQVKMAALKERLLIKRNALSSNA